MVSTITWNLNISIYICKQLNYFIIQNPKLSLLQCIENHTNKFIGKAYGILIAILLFYYIIDVPRYLSESLLSSIYRNVSFDIFTISSLIVVRLMLKHGLLILSRMSELPVFIITFIIIFIIISLVPNISISNITPISYNDFIPVMKSSVHFVIPLTLNVIVVLILNDNIENNNQFMKYLKQNFLMYFFISTIFLIGVTGMFGYYFLQSTSFSFVDASKYLTMPNFITGYESFIIIILLLGQIIFITLYIFSFFTVIEYFFNIKHHGLFINIILILIYVFSKLIAVNVYFDIQLYVRYITPLTEVIIIIPVIIIWVNRIKSALKRNSK